ncbi:MAG TPA: hypothetical protein VER12_12975 [Polyangiaceae bacterium]|nr:hypothetical protein [Polyangiaceae bacterium]
MSASAAGEIELSRCGCAKDPRRVCELCRTPEHAFLACSLSCLRAHQLAEHGSVPAETARRISHAQQEMNRRAPDASEWYAYHRRRLMDELPQSSGDLCVLGAGNCADIDLEYLAQRFREIALVDLDGDAIERSRDRQPKAVRERIVLHGDRDLSGILPHLDEWAERFPSDAELQQTSLRAAHGLLQSIGKAFDVTLSTCVLSQLVLPFQETWVLNEDEWDKLSACTTAVHLATLFGATRPGGSGFMAFDVVSSDHLPGLLAYRERPGAELQAFVEQQVASEQVSLNPAPSELLAQLTGSGLGAALARVRITLPWLWDIKSAHQLVYGLAFQRL